MMGGDALSGEVNRNNIPSILVMIFILASLAPMLNFASEEAEASGGTRHVYTFIDGTTEIQNVVIGRDLKSRYVSRY